MTKAATCHEKFGPEAHAVLNDLLDKYTEHGATQFQFPDALKIPPISERGSVIGCRLLWRAGATPVGGPTITGYSVCGLNHG